MISYHMDSPWMAAQRGQGLQNGRMLTYMGVRSFGSTLLTLPGLRYACMYVCVCMLIGEHKAVKNLTW